MHFLSPLLQDLGLRIIEKASDEQIPLLLVEPELVLRQCIMAVIHDAGVVVMGLMLRFKPAESTCPFS